MSVDMKPLERKAVTVPEAAALIAVSPLTIRRAIKRGAIKAVRTSPRGMYRIAMSELDKFLSTDSGERV